MKSRKTNGEDVLIRFYFEDGYSIAFRCVKSRLILSIVKRHGKVIETRFEIMKAAMSNG